MSPIFNPLPLLAALSLGGIVSVILLILAAVAFVAATFNFPARVNLIALGAALATIAAILCRLALVFIVLALITGCNALQAYNSHVGARQDSLSGYSKDGSYGAAFSHRVEYRQ